MTRAQMTQRILMRSLRLRRGRTLIAFLALTLAATLISSMLALYSDLESKLDKEFRSYGANIVVAARDGKTLAPGTEQRVARLLGGNALVVPSGVVIAQISANHDPIVVVGIDMSAARRLDRWWSVSQWPTAQDQALIGVRARRSLADPGEIALTFDGNSRSFHRVGTVETGGPEDSRIFIPLPAYQQWTGLGPSTWRSPIPVPRRRSSPRSINSRPRSPESRSKFARFARSSRPRAMLFARRAP